MKNTTRNKLVGTFLIVALVTMVGAALVSAETDEASDNNSEQGWFGRMCRGVNPFSAESMPENGMCKPMMQKHMPFFSELTEEQQQEIESLRTELVESGATPQEIHEAISDKLREYGIDTPTQEERLAQQIERTEQRLDILNRKKELLESGYSWEEMKEIIQEEFDIEAMTPGQRLGFRRGGPRGFCRGINNELPIEEDSEL